MRKSTAPLYVHPARYRALLAYGRADLRARLTGDEAAAVADVLNGTIFPEPELLVHNPLVAWEVRDADPNQVARWGVTRDALAEKLLSLNHVQQLALVDAVETFWNTPGADPRAILAEPPPTDPKEAAA